MQGLPLALQRRQFGSGQIAHLGVRRRVAAQRGGLGNFPGHALVGLIIGDELGEFLVLPGQVCRPS